MCAKIVPFCSSPAFAFDCLLPLITSNTSHSVLQEHRSKLLMVAILITALCCSSLLLVGLAKVYHYYRPAVQHQHAAITNDMDTLSSRGSLAAQEFLQLEPSSEYRAGLEGHYGSVRSVKSVTPRPPRGILKQSRTSENLATCSNSLTLYSNPALEPQCSPLRLQDPAAMRERQQAVSTLASGTLERRAALGTIERQTALGTLERRAALGTIERQAALGSPMHNWQPTDPSGFPSDPTGSPGLLSKAQQQGRGCERVSQTSLLCSSLREASSWVEQQQEVERR